MKKGRATPALSTANCISFVAGRKARRRLAVCCISKVKYNRWSSSSSTHSTEKPCCYNQVMGNQLQRSRSEEREFSQSTQTNESSNAPPRPFKPAHLQRTRVETLPVGGSDPRAFFLPVGNSVLQYNESPSTSVGQSLAESGVYEIVDHKDIDSESMPINELIDEYGPLLPLRFCVSDSLYGVCEESSLMEGQLLSVLFEKETKVALAKANQGAEYIVPLNSALLFSVLHNPQNKIETGKKGYKFPKVSDIMDATDMPQAVAVMKAFQCESNGNILLIMEGHVLIVKGIQEGEDGQRKLKCYVLGNKIEVLLNENIVGEFTTATSMLKLKLSDFIDHVTLPICVILENSKHQKIQLPLHTTVGSYTIIDQRKERSVVVSTAYGNKRETIEILLSVPIEAHLVKSSEQQLHLLRTETQPFYKSFHPSKLDKVIIDSNSSMNYIQSMLFKVVPEDDTWMYGVDIFPPQPPSSSFAINQEDADDYLEMSMERSFTPPPLSSHGRLPVPLPRHLPTSAPQSPPTRKSQPRPQLKPLRTNQQSNTNDDDDDDDDADYEFIDGRPPMPVPARAINQPLPPLIPPLIPPLENTSIPIPKARSTDLQLDPVPYMIAKETESGSLVHEAPYQYVKLSVERTRELELLRQKLTELETTNTQLTSHIQELKETKSGVPTNTAPDPTASLYDVSVTEANKIAASKCTSEELLIVLEKLGLGQYKEAFRNENINGTLFIDLDEEILENELKVKSKIHRIKIMRLVTGKQSVAGLLKTE